MFLAVDLWDLCLKVKLYFHRICYLVQTLATPRVLYGKVETHFRIHVNKGAQATF